MIRYDGEQDSPRTDFSRRFAGRDEWVGLYAMAARQPDPLAEYLCAYRALKAMDGRNGNACTGTVVPRVRDHDFGRLDVAGGTPGTHELVNVFEIYQERALEELARLASDASRTFLATSRAIAAGPERADRRIFAVVHCPGA